MEAQLEQDSAALPSGITLPLSYPIHIKRFEARPLNAPLLAPFTIATTNVTSVTNVGVRVELEDQSVGWGEIPTMPPVTAEDQPAALIGAKMAGAWLEAQDPDTWQSLLQRLSQHLPGHQYAAVRAGVEMAVVDAVARSLKVPLWAFFGGCTNSLTTDITIPICPPEEAAELAALYKARGFDTIKTKVGGTGVDDDVERLKAIRQGHPGCALILDANCGYSPEEALDFLQKLHHYGLDPILYEQPVPREDQDGLHHVSVTAMSQYGIPVAADESCRTSLDAEQIASEKLAHVINIKLAKVGVLGAMEVVRIAKEAGLGLMIGGMVETRMGMGFAAHLVAGIGGFRYIDLDTPLLLAVDPVQGGYQAVGPLYKLGNEPGHGAHLEWD